MGLMAQEGLYVFISNATEQLTITLVVGPRAFIRRSIGVPHHTLTMHLACVELSAVEVTSRGKVAHAVTVDLTAVKFTFVIAAIGH